MLAIKGGERVRVEPFPSWPVWGREEEEALLAALRSGVWGRGGQLTQRLGEVFASYIGSRFGVPCMNGTTALKVALRASGVGPGDKVITTPYTFVATSSVIVELGAVPIYVDIVEGGVNIDLSLVAERVDGDVKAILPVHVGGHPVDIDVINSISREHCVSVIEDAAEAHGSEWRGRRVGSSSTAGCFSFQSSKVVTSGEGGLITTNDEAVASLCSSLIDCGRTPDKDWYENDILGYNYRMSEFQAAILLEQMKRLDSQIERRQQNFTLLSKLCEELEGFSVIKPPPGASRTCHYLVMLRVEAELFRGVPKRRIVEALRAEGIPASAGWPVPLYRYPPLARYLEHKGVRSDPDAFPNTEAAAATHIFIHHRVLLGGYKEVEDVFKALRKVEKNRDEL
ncbi:MAG: DegT/DnrJ/EryC1/StrS family aminotransferase [Nitrososphaerota archaeon]